MPTPYSQRAPGSKVSGSVSALFAQEMISGRAAPLHVAHDIGVPEVIGVAGGVGHQLAKRDVAARRPRPRIAVGVKSLEHLRLGEFRKHRLDRRVERQLAALDLLHGAGAGDRLGHRGDPHHRIGGHRRACREIALAIAAFENHPVLRRRGGRDARHLARIGRSLERARNSARIDHVHSSHAVCPASWPVHEEECRLSLTKATALPRRRPSAQRPVIRSRCSG